MKRPLPIRTLARLISIASTCALLAFTPEAWADEATDLERGRVLYAEGKHEAAEQYFAKLLDGPNKFRDTRIAARGRMIRGASLMFLGRRTEAAAQFELIVRAVPDFQPDAIAYPPAVLDEFARARGRVERETASQSRVDVVGKELEQVREENRRLNAKLSLLKAYASEERTVRTNSRLVAALPFGIGQFQNGDTRLGVIFAAGEGVALVTATVSFILHNSVNPTPRPQERETERSFEVATRNVNLVSTAAFVAMVIAGAAQAEIAFVPERISTRKRPLPAPLSDSPDAVPQAPALRLAPVVSAAGGTTFFGIEGRF